MAGIYKADQRATFLCRPCIPAFNRRDWRYWFKKKKEL